MDKEFLKQALNIANQAADSAENTIQQHLASGDWSVSFKSDDSPVTEVDIATEHAIKAVLAEKGPEADFYGEETGRTDTDNSDASQALLWLVDPIDGTKSFIRNMPFYSTQIALQVNGELCVGVSNAKAYGQRLTACKGAGVFLNGESVQTRQITDLSDVFLSTGNLTTLANNLEAWSNLAEVVKTVRRVRGYGDFCHYHQLCAGQTDLIIESDVNILDIAALTVGVREAGGVITDLAGAPISLETSSVLAAATPALHAQVLPMFQRYF